MTPVIKSVELPNRVRLPDVEQGDPSSVPTLLPHGVTDARLSVLKLLTPVAGQWKENEKSMSASHKPPGYNTVSPYLIVDGASRTIDFLRHVFGAVELRRFPDSTGKILHAEVRIDDTVVMLADGGEGWPPVPSHVHIYVPEVDAVYRRALEAGAAPVQEPVKKDDEDKRGGVRDAGGTTWWIAAKVE